MVSVVVEKDIPQPAEKVWALLADFGDISWSGIDNVEVEGEGVGMIRKIIVGEGAAVERLEAGISEHKAGEMLSGFYSGLLETITAAVLAKR